MKKFFTSTGRIYAFAVGVIVDTFSFIQIINHTRFKMPALINSPWLWLSVTVTLTLSTLFIYFKWCDYKARVNAEILEHKKSFADYRKNVHKEFGLVYSQINLLIEKNNKLFWTIEELKQESKVN